jgi:serine kinase of HPr protein (carbohydrate metabolism regulator)
VIRLEEGLCEEKKEESSFCNIQVPTYHVSIGIRRNLESLVEALALNFRLQKEGKDIEQEFERKLLRTIQKKAKKRVGDEDLAASDHKK